MARKGVPPGEKKKKGILGGKSGVLRAMVSEKQNPPPKGLGVGGNETSQFLQKKEKWKSSNWHFLFRKETPALIRSAAPGGGGKTLLNTEKKKPLSREKSSS